MHNCLWSSARAVDNNRLSLTHFWVLGIYGNRKISFLFFFPPVGVSRGLHQGNYITASSAQYDVVSPSYSLSVQFNPSLIPILLYVLKSQLKTPLRKIKSKPQFIRSLTYFFRRFHNNIISVCNLYTKQLSRLKAKIYVDLSKHIFLCHILR